MKITLLSILNLFLFINFYGQDFSNKGKEFWVGYGSHVSMYSGTGAVLTTGGSQEMVFYFTSDKDANVKVEIPSTGWTRTYKVIANTITTSDLIPKTGTDDARLAVEGKSKMGIRITSDENIIAYVHIYNGSVSGATLLFPTTTLAAEYYSINYKQSTNSNYSYCFAFVIATEDSSNIEIILSANTIKNKKGDTVRTILNKGEIYNIFGKLLSSTSGDDLTGTKIRSIATVTSPCKKIAVFSGSGKVNIQLPSEGSSGSADNYIQQAFPYNAWGKRYLTAPTSKMPYNFFRVAVSEPKTIVKKNGIVLTGMINDFYYDFGGAEPNLIESDKPIMVAQYITTADKGGNITQGQGDPEMIYLSPVEQTINKVTIISTPNSAIKTHYANIVIPRAGATSLKIDGIAPSVASISHPQDASYNYYQLPLAKGFHTFESDSGFNAIVYGYGTAESYGYNAGANTKDLYQYISLGNESTGTTMNKSIFCLNTPFRLSITLPYKPLSLKWTIPNYPEVTNLSPIEDTSFDVRGRKVYQYKLPLSYSYSTQGVYPVRVLIINPTIDECSFSQYDYVDVDIKVFEPIVSNFGWEHKGFVTDAVSFFDSTNTSGSTIIKYYWDFGDGDTSMAKYPTHLYKNAGTYTVKFYVLTDIDCSSILASKTITVKANTVKDNRIKLVHVSPMGDDNGSIGLLSQPFKTIQAAIDYAIVGDTVLVHSGRYVENVLIYRKDILLASDYLLTKDTSFINNTIIDGNLQTNSLILFECNTIVNGLTIERGNSNIGAGIKVINSTSPQIQYCFIQKNVGSGDNTTSAISFQATSGVIENCKIRFNYGKINTIEISGNSTFRNSEIYENTAWGESNIMVNSAVTFYNLLIHHNSGGGLKILPGGDYAKIQNLTIYKNSSFGIWIWGLNTYNNTTAKISNSIIWGNIGENIKLTQDATPAKTIVDIDYCIIEGGNSSITQNKYLVLNYGSNNITDNPEFVSEWDLNIKDNSSAIGKGRDTVYFPDITHYVITKDIMGSNRPNPVGSKPDIGAYESTLASSVNKTVPLVLESFTVILNGKNVTIKWVVSKEENLHHFNIERSVNLVSWENVGSVLANHSINYNFIDYNLTNGVYYYRLKSIDYDGKFSYSNIEKLSLSGMDKTTLYPNPVTNGFLTITLSTKGYISIYNNLGVQQFQKFFGVGTQRINVQSLVNGSYYLKTGNSIYSFIKQ